jgi:hypothetical protein
MKIEKKRVVNSSKLSITAKRAAAAALGITTVVSLSACEDTLSANGSSQPPETTPTCGVEECGSELSSSSYTDISSSGEHLSGSSLDALSSAAKMSSNSNEPPLSAGVPLISSPSSSKSSSSAVVPVSSSEEEPIQLSGDIAPFEDSSSSSEVETPQSSSNPIKIDTITPDTVKQEPYTIHCEESDSTGYNLRLCKDQNGLTIFSMVTTFEQDDLQA